MENQLIRGENVKDATWLNNENLEQSIVTSDAIQAREMTQADKHNPNALTKVKFGEVFETNIDYENHPFAEIFPDVTSVEYENLLEDMRVHGQYEPVIIFEGKIADGRTRQRAQRELDKPVLAHTWLGEPEELLNYLYAKSQHRHLNSQQRAVIALQFVEAERELAKRRQGMRTDLNRIVNEIKAKGKGRALDHVAKKTGTNRTYIAHAEYISNNAKELLDYVKRNELPIANARLLAQKLPKQEEREQAIKKYKSGDGTMKSIIDDMLFEKEPAHETNNETSEQRNVVNNLSLGILFTMTINESAVVEIKDVLHKHGYSERPYKILVATDAKKAQAIIEPLIEQLPVTAYVVEPTDTVSTVF